MSRSVNRAVLVGNLGKDPEIHPRRSGEGRIVNFTLATHDSWMDSETGIRKQKTEWHRIVSHDEHINGVLERHCSKGSQVYIEARLRYRKWTDQQGQARHSTDIVIERHGCDLLILGRPGGDHDR